MKGKSVYLAVFSFMLVMLSAPLAGVGQEISYEVFELAKDKKGNVPPEAIQTLEKEMNKAASNGFYFKELAFGFFIMNRSVEESRPRNEYRILELTKDKKGRVAPDAISTLEKEMNQAASGGFCFNSFMTKFIIMNRTIGDNRTRCEYRLLTAENWSFFRAQLHESVDHGYVYKSLYTFQPVSSADDDMLIVFERDAGGTGVLYEYRVITSLDEKEFHGAVGAGFRLKDAASDPYIFQKPLQADASQVNLTVNFQPVKTKACGTSEVDFSANTDKLKHPTPEPDAGKTMAYFLRPGTFFNQAKLAIDGEWLGANRGNNYFYFNVDPGTHLFCVKSGSSYRALRLTMEPDKTYFLLADEGFDYFNFKWISETEGRKKLEKLNLSVSEKKR